MNRITHKHVTDACARYNAALHFKREDCGYLQWADVAGWGTYRPRLYAQGSTGGLVNSHMQRRTMRQTIAAIDAAIRAHRLRYGWQVIIQAIHERGETQKAMLHELNRRGLWLSPEQRVQAGVGGMV